MNRKQKKTGKKEIFLRQNKKSLVKEILREDFDKEFKNVHGSKFERQILDDWMDKALPQ